MKFRPQRDLRGRVTEPAHVWLFAEEQPRPAPTPADASLPVPAVWLRGLAHGSRVTFVDARGASRALQVVATDAEGCWVESTKTCYVESGTVLHVERADAGTRMLAQRTRELRVRVQRTRLSPMLPWVFCPRGKCRLS